MYDVLFYFVGIETEDPSIQPLRYNPYEFSKEYFQYHFGSSIN